MKASKYKHSFKKTFGIWMKLNRKKVKLILSQNFPNCLRLGNKLKTIFVCFELRYGISLYWKGTKCKKLLVSQINQNGAEDVNRCQKIRTIVEQR